MTLISVLKGVSYGWRQERLAQNAGELRRIASEFYDRVRAFGELYGESGRHLAKAVEAYNRSVGSWESRLQPSLKRMRELGAGGAEGQAAVCGAPRPPSPAGGRARRSHRERRLVVVSL